MQSRKMRFAHNHSNSFSLIQSPSIFPLLLRLSADGCITYASKCITNLTGYSQQEVLHSFFKDYCCSNDYQVFLQKLEETFARDEDYFEMDLCMKGKDGSNCLVHIDAAVLRNNENHKLAELLLVINGGNMSELLYREKLTQYEQLANHLVEAVLIIYEQKIVFANKASKDLFEASSLEEIVGRSLSTFLYHEDVEVWKEKMGREYVEPLEMVWKTVRGNTFHSEVFVIPTTYMGKKAFQLLVRDVTEKRKAEKTLIQAEKLSIAGQLAAGIAHEIRNPITALKGFLQLMRLDLEAKSDYWDIMESELERIETISNELLFLAKPRATELKPIQLKKLIQEVCLLLESQANLHNIALEKHIPDEEITIFGNDTQIKQVFVNLIKNAIEVMPNGGQIVINVEKYEDNVHISITDEGCGIPADYLDKIGNPFFTTKKDGTGLGLMVTYNIIRNHNGAISVSSEVDVGSTFKITLPLFNTAQIQEDNGVE